jgi:hypothetical protein
MKTELVKIDTLQKDLNKAKDLLHGVIVSLEGFGYAILTQEDQPTVAKKTGKKRGRKPGSKNKTAEVPPPAAEGGV